MDHPTAPHDPYGHPSETPGYPPPEQWFVNREGPRDPGSPGRATLAWFLVLAIVAYIAITNMLMGAAPSSGADPLGPGGLDTVMGRYTVGAGAMFSSNPSLGEQLRVQFEESFGRSTGGKLRAAIIAAEMGDVGAALGQLDTIDALDPSDEENAEARRLSGALRTLYAHGADALTPDEREALRDSQGWFGELALTHGLPDSDPARAAAIGPAKRVVFALLTIVGLAAGGLVVGVGLFIAAIVLYVNGKIRCAYAAPAPGGSVYLETFAVFLVSFVVVSALAAALSPGGGMDVSMLLVWALVAVPLLPLALGVSWRKHVFAMGWHRGRGVVREAFAGVFGYVAGLPIVAFGVLLTVLLAALIQVVRDLMGLPPAPPASHPVIDEIRAGNRFAIIAVYALACVWAPVVEESVFRGALYHHMRARVSAGFSAFFVAFLFAAIHPQGIAAVPALMSLAVVFALVREWRGSLIGPIVAHALHNGALVTAMVVALG